VMNQTNGGTARKRVLSGIQPTGEVHLGNYLGALRQWVHMQDEYECFYSIVDLHAILGDGDPADLPSRTLDMAISVLAVGVDPERCTLFVQSDVPEHIELAWLFNTVAPVGDLERMTQYKDKSQQYDSIPVGLLNYPVLQAADILIYRADAVPVGEDQRQHLELTRDIARKWNARYGEYLPEPGAIIPEVGRIRGLDGETKMSKSLGNTVCILADEEDVWGRVRTAVTDPQRVRRGDPGRPEVCNVFTLHKLVTDVSLIPDIEEQCRAGSRGCVDCKRIFADSLVREFAPFRERAEHLRAHPAHVRDVLEEGADRARAVARETLAEVRSRMGISWRTAL
jgi:tryptophanyl-tRNA synthetase